MTPADVGGATAMILRGDWGDRGEFLSFAASQAECRPFVASSGPDVVATGIGTANGPVGWVGAIFVDSAFRRRGIGQAVTDAVVGALEAAGCRTLVLVASKEGRPMYERMGFELQTEYVTLEAPGTADGQRPGAAARPFEPGDLEGMARLDRTATGEDRAHLLARFASLTSARVLTGPDGEVVAFSVRAPWGGGATIARAIDDAVAILEARRAVVGPERIVRAGVPRENVAGIERLKELGWRRSWRAPRLARGAPLEWRPEQIWGQFAMALG